MKGIILACRDFVKKYIRIYMKLLVKDNQLLLEALKLLSPDSSMSTIRSWLKEGRVTVDGKTCKISKFAVEKDQTIEVGKRNKTIDEGIEILYQDHHIVVIVKPEGLLSVSTDFEKNRTAHKVLKKHLYPKQVSVVHRLDQDTSGVMLFALDEKSKETLKNTFEKHAIERKYVAVVEGNIEDQQGTWDSFLFEDKNYLVHSTTNPSKGKQAISHFEVLEKSKNFSMLNVTLETGKKNQIRVHCKDAGHPVIGDTKYGATSNPAKRLGLHAYHLAFNHPITGKKIRFSIPFPATFSRLFKR